jgi:beta-phosphoglucomutase-like phosphatase (HAD superfamily)
LERRPATRCTRPIAPDDISTGGTTAGGASWASRSPTLGPPDLEALAAEWWLAFDAAERALAAAHGLVGPDRLRAFGIHLAEQHARMARALQGLARERQAGSPLVAWLGEPRLTRRVLGLPEAVEACVFELDVVLTTSEQAQMEAWADTFDDFLVERAERGRQELVPFDRRRDYARWIGGRTRLEGVRLFLSSRGIRLPEGTAGDPPTAETVHGLANRKNERLQRRLRLEGVTAFAGSRSYLQAARIFGVHRAVVSASANTAAILERAGLARLVEQRVDGEAFDAERLRAKPAPDSLLSACRRLAVDPARSAAFESTKAGVAAARAAGFNLVIGVRRDGQVAPLGPRDADLVVNDLADLLVRRR